MRHKYGLISLVLLTVLFFTSVLSGAVVSIQSEPLHYEEEANILKGMGLFYGTDKGFELERPPTRLEALVMLLRLLGLEKEAEASDFYLPFVDVPIWGQKYVAYAYHNGLTYGYGADSQAFGSSDVATEAHYITFVLRALGYDDTKGDFYWADARAKGEEIELIDKDYKAKISDKFLRDHCVGVSYLSLFTPLKGESKVLITKLLEQKAIDLEKVKETFDLSDKYALEGAKAYAKRKVDLAMDLYSEAIKLKPESSQLYNSLNEVYTWMVKTSREEKDKQFWLLKRQEIIDKMLELEPLNPQFIHKSLIHLFDLKIKDEAFEQAKSLFQLDNESLESAKLLARASAELGIDYLLNSKEDEGIDILREVLDLFDSSADLEDATIQFYLGKINLALENFEQAKKYLAAARESTEFKYESDRLQYLINEVTGRTADNEKYKAYIWMGHVESSLEYKEMKAVLESYTN